MKQPEGRIRLKDLLNEGIESSSQHIISTKAPAQNNEPQPEPLSNPVNIPSAANDEPGEHRSSMVKDWISKEKEKAKLSTMAVEDLYNEVVNAKRPVINITEVQEEESPVLVVAEEIKPEELAEETEVEEISKNKVSEYKIQGMVKVSSETGKLIIEKMDDEQVNRISAPKPVEEPKETPKPLLDDANFPRNKGYQRPQDVLKDWLGFFYVQHDSLDIAHKQLHETAGSIASGTEGLSQKLNALITNADMQCDQAKKIASIASSVKLNGEDIELADSLNLINKEVNDATDKILTFSQKAMSVAGALENTQGDLAVTQLYISQMQKIIKQANLLAINANIESARLGEAGRGFEAVTNEIRLLSKEISDLSQSVGDKIGNAVTSLNQTNATLDGVNISSNIQLKEKIDTVIQSITQQNNNLINAMAENISLSQQTADMASAITADMKFSDEAAQYINNIASILKVITQQTAIYKAAAVKSLGVDSKNSDISKEVLEKILSELSAEQLKSKFLQFLAKEAMASG